MRETSSSERLGHHMTLNFIKQNTEKKRNELNIALRRAKASYYTNLGQENSNGDPSKFWKTVKSIYPIKAKSLGSSQVFELMEKTQLTNLIFQIVPALFYGHHYIFTTKVSIAEGLCIAVSWSNPKENRKCGYLSICDK